MPVWTKFKSMQSISNKNQESVIKAEGYLLKCPRQAAYRMVNRNKKVFSSWTWSSLCPMNTNEFTKSQGNSHEFP